MSKPPVSLSDLTDTEGVQRNETSAAQTPTEVLVKRVLAGVVGTCGALIPFLPEHTIGYKVCFVVVGIGAALGITSQGVRK